MKPNFIRVAASIEDQTVLKIDTSDTDNVVSCDVLILNLEIEAGIACSVPGNHKVESFVPDGQLTLPALDDLCFVLLSASTCSQFGNHKQFHAANDFSISLNDSIEDVETQIS
jgi:hypothetical protein